jgi:S1-C subfamily serine protease
LRKRSYSRGMESDGRPVMTVFGGPDSRDPEPVPQRRWNTPRLRRQVLIGVLAAWAVAITALVLVHRDGPAPQATTAPRPAPSASDGPLGTAEIYRTLLPSVVRIESVAGRTGETGTGVIVNADGLVLTALHVIDGAKTITLTYADGSTSAATVTSRDAKQDIATVTPAKLPETVVPAVLGGAPAVGGTVVAIGNPLGLNASTSSGVVSGLGRSLTRKGQADLAGLIQFDAAVNPGSSGGPLLNTKGQVIGIVTGLANAEGAKEFAGIGFAVPIATAGGAAGAPAK